MVSWVELVTKQFNASAAASEWFLGHMADDTWWPMQVRLLLSTDWWPLTVILLVEKQLPMYFYLLGV